ncbi:MAG TPA: macro domain-containing protein [bacterium]|nr:macro domain-containing protein [bacterium]HPG47243.1 macro domain-containing protein [bacterium]HPM99715.1 macro domain-containing protein [bacterium]
MIHLVQGNIINADAEALVNTVNTQGVMGKGIALQFKRAFPDNYKAYKKVCDRNELQPGKLFVFDRHTFTNPRYIINFPTKVHWRSNSRYEYIESGLQALVKEIKERAIQSIAIPPLGSGLGGLEWERVRALIETALTGLQNVAVHLYEPSGAPKPESMVNCTHKPNMTHGRASLLLLMDSYAVPGYDYRLSLLEVQKLMYFMQQSGENLKLDFAKGAYGPYADNLRHVLNHIEGHFISGFGDGKNKPDVELHITDRKYINEASTFLNRYPETLANLKRVQSLIQGFETPFGMELLSSVHWVCDREKSVDKNDIDAVTKAVFDWNERKRNFFKPEQIRIAWEALIREGWIEK